MNLFASTSKLKVMLSTEVELVVEKLKVVLMVVTGGVESTCTIRASATSSPADLTCKCVHVCIWLN